VLILWKVHDARHDLRVETRELLDALRIRVGDRHRCNPQTREQISFFAVDGIGHLWTG
jgi:hypothetical protein